MNGSLQKRLAKAEQELADDRRDNEPLGWLVIYDGDTGEIVHRTPLPSRVLVSLPDDRRNPHLRRNIGLGTIDELRRRFGESADDPNELR